MKLIALPLRILLLIGLMTFGCVAVAADISDIRITTEGNQTRLHIDVDTHKKPKVFTMDGSNPRVVMDITGTQFSPALLAKAKGKGYLEGTGAINKLRFAKRGENELRLVVDLNTGAKYISHVFKDDVLTVVMSGDPITRVKDGIPVPRLKASRRAKLVKKPIIVIDPGHGGHDPGAIGSAKVREETVTLKAALELRRQLLASGKYKVVMTRTTDKYVEHDKRVLIARKAGADLFISLHADSLKSSATRGASVYTLATRAEGRTYEVVNNQNWVLDVDLTRKSMPVSDILVDLAQRKTLTKSGQFADILIFELQKKTRMVGNSHRRAGLYVLLAPDVPAVLLEMGFISNKSDEKLLNSSSHRKKLMKGVTKAIDRHFKKSKTAS